MKLITKELENKLAKYPFGSQEDKGDNAKILVKFFSPVGAATWWVTEAEKQENGKWLFFGVADLGLGFREYGEFSQEELEEIRLPFGLHVERDMYFGENEVIGSVLPLFDGEDDEEEGVG